MTAPTIDTGIRVYDQEDGIHQILDDHGLYGEVDVMTFKLAACFPATFTAGLYLGRPGDLIRHGISGHQVVLTIARPEMDPEVVMDAWETLLMGVRAVATGTDPAGVTLPPQISCAEWVQDGRLVRIGGAR